MPHSLDNTMKNFSTIALKLTAASVFAALVLLTVPNAQAASCEFLPNAPDQHTVMRGDTLWDISGKFLQHPWCWPQVWGLNRDQIIYVFLENLPENYWKRVSLMFLF